MKCLKNYGRRFMRYTGGSDQDHPQEKKKYNKAKSLSEEASQIAVNRREAKGKGEKERYIHSNAEFQRIGRKDKKAFFSDQCKEIEGKKKRERERTGKTRVDRKSVV